MPLTHPFAEPSASPADAAGPEMQLAMKEMVDRVCVSRDSAQLLRSKNGKEVLRVRGSQDSWIVKLWSRPGWRTRLRRLLTISPIHREARMLEHLARSGLDVPRVYGVWRLDSCSSSYTDAMVMEDLGEGVTGASHLKALVQRQESDAAAAFDERLIRATATILTANVVDPDHSLINFYVTQPGRLVRLDLEEARWRVPGGWSRGLLSQMIGRLVSSYTFAVQPEVERVTVFAEGLRQRLALEPAVWRGARKYVAQRMDQQRAGRGIDTRVQLPW